MLYFLKFISVVFIYLCVVKCLCNKFLTKKLWHNSLQPGQARTNSCNSKPLFCKQRKRCTRFILLKIQNDIRHIVCIFNILHVRPCTGWGREQTGQNCECTEPTNRTKNHHTNNSFNNISETQTTDALKQFALASLALHIIQCWNAVLCYVMLGSAMLISTPQNDAVNLFYLWWKTSTQKSFSSGLLFHFPSTSAYQFYLLLLFSRFHSLFT